MTLHLLNGPAFRSLNDPALHSIFGTIYEGFIHCRQLQNH